MNWKQYFELRDKKKVWFKRFFWILLLLHLLFFGGAMIKGTDTVCNLICNMTAIQEKEMSYKAALRNISQYDNFSGNVSESLDGVNASDIVQVNDSAMLSDTDVEEDKQEAVYKVYFITLNLTSIVYFNATDFYHEKIWHRCPYECWTNGKRNHYWPNFYRTFYGPLFFLLYIIPAYLLAIIWHTYNTFKLENAKPESDEEKEKDTKEEKKK